MGPTDSGPFGRGWRRLKKFLALARNHRAAPSTYFKQRRYYRSLFWRQAVPLHPVSYLPDGFCVRKIGESGLSVIENFCTAQEAAAVIQAAEPRLARSTVVNDQVVKYSERRTSDTAVVFDKDHQDPAVLPLLYRASMLLGLPSNHVERVYVTRYRPGQKFDKHLDHYAGYRGDRLYTLLVYLNDLGGGGGGETVFHSLKLAVQPKAGRAITWTNKNPDGSGHNEVDHSGAPVLGEKDKWIVQLWYRRYKMFAALADPAEPPQARKGRALSAAEALPPGVDRLT